MGLLALDYVRERMLLNMGENMYVCVYIGHSTEVKILSPGQKKNNFKKQ